MAIGFWTGKVLMAAQVGFPTGGTVALAVPRLNHPATSPVLEKTTPRQRLGPMPGLASVPRGDVVEKGPVNRGRVA